MLVRNGDVLIDAIFFCIAMALQQVAYNGK